MNYKYLIIPACLMAFNAIADEEKPTLTGSSELGLLFKSGNTSSTDFKGGLDLKHEEGLWRNTAGLAILAKKTEVVDAETGKKSSETSDQKWSAALQSNYTLDTESKDYVWGNVSYEDDRFSGFAYQSSYAAGWGKRWFETEDAYFDAEIGAGLKADETQAGVEQSAAIMRIAATYEQTLLETVKFKQTISANIVPDADKNSKYKAISSVTTKLMDSLALKFSFTLDYNSVVSAGSENTDTETSLTLVYSF